MPASFRFLALTALVALVGCPSPGGVAGSPSPEATKKVSTKPSKKPSASPSGTAQPSGAPGTTQPSAVGRTSEPGTAGTPKPAGTPTPTPAPTGTPTPTPTATASATAAPSADKAAIDAATVFPFTAVGQTWTYDTNMAASSFNLKGTRVISVKAVTADGATVSVKSTTTLPMLAGGGDKTSEADVVVPKTASDPYYVIEAGLGKLGDLAAGASTFTAKTETVLGAAAVSVVVRSYAVPAPADFEITNTLAAGKGLVAATLKGKKLPAEIVLPISIPINSYTLTSTLKTFSPTAP